MKVKKGDFGVEMFKPSFVSPKILFREEEEKKLRERFHYTLEHNEPIILLLKGPEGQGKRVFMKNLIKLISKKCDERSPIIFLEADCRDKEFLEIITNFILNLQKNYEDLVEIEISPKSKSNINYTDSQNLCPIFQILCQM